jgi:hypothetical protein
MFVEVGGASLPQAGQGDWREVAGLAEVEELAKSLPVSTQARLWPDREAYLFVSMFFTSDSGDWSHSVDYCFRPDATLALVDANYSTFLAHNGGVRRLRTRVFAREGHVLSARENVVALNDGSPRPNERFIGSDEPIYPRWDALPFASLLGSGLTRR